MGAKGAIGGATWGLGMKRTVRAQIVADTENARQVIARALCAATSATVVASTDCVSAEAAVSGSRPDILLGCAEAGADLAALQELADRFPETLVLLVVSDITKRGRSAARGRLSIANDVAEWFTESGRRTASGNGLSDDLARLGTLTEREREVLALTADGQSIDEIAYALHRTHSTIVKHRDSIMRKLDVHDRVALARFAYRVGLMAP